MTESVTVRRFFLTLIRRGGKVGLVGFVMINYLILTLGAHKMEVMRPRRVLVLEK